MELAGRIAFEAARLRPFLPTYLHLLASALFPIYVGAHASLSIPASAAPPTKKERQAHDDGFADDEPEVAAEKVEGLTPKDAILFPLLAGFTLSSLYFIIKWLEDPSMLNKILSYYFMQIGIVFGAKFLKDAFTVIRSMCLPNQYSHGGHVWKANRLKQWYDAVDAGSDIQDGYHTSPLPGQFRRLPVPKIVTDQIWRIRSLLYAKCSFNFHIHKLVTFKAPVDVLDALAIITSLAIVGYFTFFNKTWYVSNLLGFAFCYGSTQYMSPTTFWTGTLLLSALFFYDIYFVFFTPMMVTVATKLDIPIKLLFPRPASPAETEKGLDGLAMLGLGDIVIPGMMIALALRFDLYLHYLRRSKTVEGKVEKATYAPVTGGWGERFWVGRSIAGPDLQAKAFPKTYFKVGLIGYALGMIVTLLVMQIAGHAQPALLYLVPGVLGALWGAAALKGDINQMWNYTEDKEAAEKSDSSKSEKGKQMKTAKEPHQSDNPAKNIDSHVSGEDTKDRRPGETEELASTSITAEEDSNNTSDSEEDSHPTSESTSDSHRSGSDTPSSSQSANKARSKPTTTARISKKQEQKCRHLIYLSIDFPPPPQSTAQTDSTKPVLSSHISGDGVGGRGRQKKGWKKSGNGTLTPAEGEPPGKRRRVV